MLDTYILYAFECIQNYYNYLEVLTGPLKIGLYRLITLDIIMEITQPAELVNSIVNETDGSI